MGVRMMDGVRSTVSRGRLRGPALALAAVVLGSGLLAACGSSSSSSSTSTGKVLLVGNYKGHTGQYTSIQAAVNAAQPGKCTNLAGKTTLHQALCLIAASRSTVSNDSGLMHVAAAFGVPQVAIFGSSSPLHTPPLSDKARVLWLKADPDYQPPLVCAPCFKRVCPLSVDEGHMRCLNDITARRVLQVLQD